MDETSEKEETDDQDEYLSDGRKKGVRTIQDVFPQVKTFKVENVKVYI